MPFIHITSLPLEKPVAVPPLLEKISEEFAQILGLDVKYVTATWTFLAAGHCASGGKALHFQSHTSHPLLVSLVVPGFYRGEQISKALHAAASAISLHADIAKTNIFIQAEVAKSGCVFDNGTVMTW